MRHHTILSIFFLLAGPGTAYGTTGTVFRTPIAARQDVPSTPAPTKTPVPDGWQCATKNITQYFAVPKPTGALLDALDSYGVKLIEPCRSTASGLDKLSCTVSPTSQWCGMTTAAPASLRAAYDTYGSMAASWWAGKSSAIASVSEECPIGWSRPSFSDHYWLNLTIAHANCYIGAHPGESPKSTSIVVTTRSS